MMKNLLVSFFVFNLIAAAACAQINQSKFFIRFTDKNSNPYSLSNPSAFLSSRAIARRTTQGIGYNNYDLPVTPQYLTGVAAAGATLWAVSKWFNGVSISVPDSTTYNAVMALPYVLNITRVYKMPVRKSTNKFDLENVNSSALSYASERNGNDDQIQSSNYYNYGGSYNQIHLMNGEYLHNLGYHGEGMVIALLDAGFYNADTLAAFDSLFAGNRVLGTWDFVANEPTVYDDFWHGEAVLSCIAGNVPGSLVGTAPKASFWLLRSEDANTENIIEEYNWASAAEYADSAGTDLISTSLGYTQFDSIVVNNVTVVNPANHTYNDMNGHTCPSSIAANIAASKGILVIAAAGNEGGAAWHYISAPSDGDSAMSVAAVDSNGYHAGFSSYGPAYGGAIKPNVAAKGQSTIVAYSDGSIGGGSGTSFATPVLAGSAACLWQAHPAMTNMQIYHAIEQSANYHNAPNDSLGFGIPDFMLANQILNVMENKIKTEDIVVYPNPFTNQIQFLYTSPKTQGTITIQLFDVLGRTVFLDEKQYDSIHSIILPKTDALEKGIYFLKISDGEQATIKSVAKM
jgi:serine protease AprX